ncbi:MAG: hypothetical protein JNL80_17410 [Phycisphaerae bacterium]|nr:hypothetical protein [Phycisphaerae bacterium]
MMASETTEPERAFFERRCLREALACLAYAFIPGLLAAWLVLQLIHLPPAERSFAFANPAFRTVVLCAAITLPLLALALCCVLSRQSVTLDGRRLRIEDGIWPRQRVLEVSAGDVEQWAVTLTPYRSLLVAGTGKFALTVRLRGRGWVPAPLRFTTLKEAEAAELSFERLHRLPDELDDFTMDERSELDACWRDAALSQAASVRVVASGDGVRILLPRRFTPLFSALMAAALSGVFICLGWFGVLDLPLWLVLPLAVTLVWRSYVTAVPTELVVTHHELRCNRKPLLSIPLDTSEPIVLDCRSRLRSPTRGRQPTGRTHDLRIAAPDRPVLILRDLSAHRGQMLAALAALERALGTRAYSRPTPFKASGPV